MYIVSLWLKYVSINYRESMDLLKLLVRSRRGKTRLKSETGMYIFLTRVSVIRLFICNISNKHVFNKIHQMFPFPFRF